MAYWLLVGPPANWEIAVKKKIWGLSFKHQKRWKQITAEDIALCYATAPVKGIIAIGTVSGTRQNTTLFWPQEVSDNRSLWPLRIAFGEMEALLIENWQTARISISWERISLQTALQHIDDARARVIVQDLRKAIGSG